MSQPCDPCWVHGLGVLQVSCELSGSILYATHLPALPSTVQCKLQRGLSVTFLSKLWDDGAPSEQLPKGTGKLGSAWPGAETGS